MSALVIAYGNFMFRWRNYVFPVVMIGLMAGFAPALFHGDMDADRDLDLAGYAVAVIGQALRFAVVGLEYIKRGGLDKRIYAAKLVTGGLFATSRNPLYLGNILILIGLLMIHNSPYVYVLCGGFFLFTYWALVLAEERYLAGQFGAEYAEYRARVPRWFPRLSLLPEALSGMRFNWRRAIAKEYSSCIAWVISALVIDAYGLVRLDGFASHRRDLAEFAAGIAVALVLLFVIHAMKKAKGGLLRNV